MRLTPQRTVNNMRQVNGNFFSRLMIHHGTSFALHHENMMKLE